MAEALRYMIGIDPGLTGAIACLDLGTGDVYLADMPIYKGKNGKTVTNSAELAGIFRDIHERAPGAVSAFLEQVWSRPKEGVSSAFRFGQNYGSLQTALAAFQIPVHDVTPPVWKKHFGLSKEKDSSRGLATQFFPRQYDQFKLVKHHGRAEAALIALYGQRKLT